MVAHSFDVFVSNVSFRLESRAKISNLRPRKNAHRNSADDDRRTKRARLIEGRSSDTLGS